MDIREAELLFLLLLFFIVAFGHMARKLKTPYPIVMILGGLLLSFIPAVPHFALNPDLVFLVVLPPLIYSSAWTTSWRDFRLNLINILFLAFGLVAFTVAGVAFAAPKVLTGFDWRLGLVLGAIVAPTDAIAAASIARRVGLPSKIVDVLEGESLINDATGLLALQFATALVVSRQVPTVSEGLLALVWLVVGGVGLGLLVGWVVYLLERRIDDGPIEIALSILTPYAAYFVADAVHASGVLAVVACGLYLTRKSATMFSPAVRIQIWSFWQSFSFVLNGLVFVLIGLQLPGILVAIQGRSLSSMVLEGAIFSLILVLLRLLWVFPGTKISYLLRKRGKRREEAPPSSKQTFVVGWTGMRGVVSLAAALSLPVELANGNAFPERNFIVFLTFCVILVTLVLQGLSLPSLVRVLGLQGSAGPNCEEREARRLVLEAAMSHLETNRAESDAADEMYEDLLGHYKQRLATLHPDHVDGPEATDHYRMTEIKRDAARVERETAVRLRNEGRINDEVLRRIERELDLSESRFTDFAHE